MSKIDDFKAGAKAVAEPTAQKLEDVAVVVESISKERDEKFNAFADEVINEFESLENRAANVERVTCFDDIYEDHDVTVLLEVFKKYYITKELKHTETSLAFIRGINMAARESVVSSTTYEAFDIKNTYDKEKVSTLLFSLLCICNKLVDQYDADDFQRVKEELYISNSQMTAIEKSLSGLVEFHSVDSLVQMFVREQVVEEVQEEDTPVEKETAYAMNDEAKLGYPTLKSMVVEGLSKIGESFLQYQEEKEKAKIAEFLNQHQLEIVDGTIVAFINYKKAYLKEKMDILFTTHGLYVTCNKKVHKLSYLELIQKGRGLIDENMAMGQEQTTTFSLLLSDDVIVRFDAEKFNNEGLLNLLMDLMTSLDEDMIAERDTIMAIAEMSDPLKETYLKIIVNLLKNSGLGCEEVFRLAHDLKVSKEMVTVLDGYIGGMLEPIDVLLETLVDRIPYPSSTYVGYALVKDCYKILYIAKGHDPDTFKVRIEEATYLNTILNKFEIRPQDFEDLDASLLEVKLAFNQLSEKDYDRIIKRLKESAKMFGGSLAVFVCSSVAVTGFSGVMALSSLSGIAGLAALGSIGFLIPGVGQVLAVTALGSAAIKKTVVDRYSFIKERKQIIGGYLESYTGILDELSAYDCETLTTYSKYYRGIKSELTKQYELIVKLERDYKSVPLAGDILDKVEAFGRMGFGKKKKS